MIHGGIRTILLKILHVLHVLEDAKVASRAPDITPAYKALVLMMVYDAIPV